MSMYERFAKDVSDELFDSVYSDLYALALALADNKARYEAAKRKRDYRPGETQYVLNDFCHNRLSLGDALDHIRICKAYAA